MSEAAARKGFSLTLMERVLQQMDEEAVVRMLRVQYRMHADIMRWSSEALYKGRLVAHESVEKHLLKDLPGIKEDENTCKVNFIWAIG